MRKKGHVVIPFVMLALIVMGAALLPPEFRRQAELRRRAASIERISGRTIRPGSLSNMNYQAFRIGDGIGYVHKLLPVAAARIGETGKRSAPKFEEYTFHGGAATVYLYVEYDAGGKVRYVALQ